MYFFAGLMVCLTRLLYSASYSAVQVTSKSQTAVRRRIRSISCCLAAICCSSSVLRAAALEYFEAGVGLVGAGVNLIRQTHSMKVSASTYAFLFAFGRSLFRLALKRTFNALYRGLSAVVVRSFDCNGSSYAHFRRICACCLWIVRWRWSTGGVGKRRKDCAGFHWNLELKAKRFY
jgi:hypothetical protein